jgi:hypothetical protein
MTSQETSSPEQVLDATEPDAAGDGEAVLEVEEEEPEAEADEEQPSDDFIFPAGKALTGEKSYAITSNARTNVIVVAGAPSCGKTTLISVVYELFLRGPFAGQLFAGSETLEGFEERCHLARIASYTDYPDTARSLVSASEHLLHLRLSSVGEHIQKDLLIADLSGEDYREAKDDYDLCKAMSILARSDHLAVLVDGAKLCMPDTRQQAFTDAQKLLRMCLDTGILNAAALVQVIFTKWDIVEGSEKKESVLRFVESKEMEFRTRFETRLARISFHKVAARPPSCEAVLKMGHGLDTIVQDWTNENYDSVSWNTRNQTSLDRGDSSSEFDMFLERHIQPIGGK